VDVVALEEIQSVTFGGYQLLERLAMGGMAEVFLARPDGQERFVAVKRILPNIAADDDFIAMFIDEAKIAGQLTHPNIAQILDIGKINTSYFIAMEYVSGHDVRALWDRVREAADTEGKDATRGLPIPMACHIVKKLAEGLDHAHRKRDAKGRPLGIIHRDVSPQNVLISYDGELKIIDFGIAKAANRIVKTQTGILKGKFAYMAPEQARGEPIDHRSDIFAIGVVLYELLTGERAFKGDTDFVLLEKVRRVDVIPARDLRPDLPRELERIMMKALGREASERYAWASALAGDLDRFMSDQGLTTSRDELGAYVRRVFRPEHAEEHRRLALYRRKAGGGDRTERIESGSSVIRGGASAKNARSRRGSEEGLAFEGTEVGDFAEQATALAANTNAVNAMNGGNAKVTDPPVDTKRSLPRKRRDVSGERANSARSDDAPASSRAPPTAVGPSVQSLDVPPSTGSHRRRRQESVSAEARSRAEASVSETVPPPLGPAALDAPTLPPPLYDGNSSELDDSRAPQGSMMSQSSGQGYGAAAAPRRGSDNVVIVVACLLGALLGAALGVGITMSSRPPSPDTLIVATPRQSEVRRGDDVICAQTPCAVHLGRGKHELLLQAPGAEPVSATVEVGEGAAVLDVTLDRLAKGVRVETDPPGATVIVDDVPLPDVTPVVLPPVAVGKAVRLALSRDGFDSLTAIRIVEGDEVWRFDLPTPTTVWTVTAEPDDALVEIGRLDGAGKLTATIGRRALSGKVQRPGCSPVEFSLVGTGKAKAEKNVVLDCRELSSKLAIVTSRRPRLVKIDGVPLPKGARLDGYLVPPGTWNVDIINGRGRRETGTIETVPGELREIRLK
jgi:serine/threonine protein kinase